MFFSDLCKENCCKTVSLNAFGLLLLLWTNLENISQILIFADLTLPRNSAKIGRRENFPFYGIKMKISYMYKLHYIQCNVLLNCFSSKLLEFLNILNRNTKLGMCVIVACFISGLIVYFNWRHDINLED